MTPTATSRGLMEQARLTIRRAVVRRSLEEAAAGKSQTVTIDLDEKGLDVAALVHEVTTRLPPDGQALQRLVNALHRSGTTDAIIDGLGARDDFRRARCARLSGKPWILSRDKVLDARQRYWICDPGRAAAELGFEAQTSLREGIAATLEWYREAQWLTY